MTVYEVCPTCGRGDGPYWVFPRSWTPAMVKVWLIDHPEFEALETESTPPETFDSSVAGC